MNKFIKNIAIFFILGLSISNISEARAEKNETLSVRQHSIISISAFTAYGDMQKLESALDNGLNAGLTITEIKEIMIHSYAYAGFPRALNGINMFMTVLDKRKAQGISDKVGKEASPMPPNFDKTVYGNQIRNSLLGQGVSNRPSGYSVFVPTIDKFLVEHLFADIFSRDILNHQERELITISILATMTGVEPQLQTHLRIAMNSGFSKSQLFDFVEVLKHNISVESAERVTLNLNNLLGTTFPMKQTKFVKVIKKGNPTKSPADHFTGNVTIESMFSSDMPNNYSGAVVNFAATSRTAWHTHPYGQTLIIISGHGLVQGEGEAIQEIFPGDVVWIPANKRHWHGATINSPMSHVAISTSLNGDTVKWMEQVNDVQYGPK